MTGKSCFDCQHRRRKQTGPFEFQHSCTLQQRDFPLAEHCSMYQPETAPSADENEFWPGVRGWETACE
jgi:hypothetical protein